MKMLRAFMVCGLIGFGLNGVLWSQTRDELVRGDRERLQEDSSWYYNDLQSGLAAASESGQPLMVVLRCIP